MATKLEIVALITAMEECFVNKDKKSDEACALYCAILGDLDSELVKMAAMDLMSSNTFFPTPAEWRKRAIDLATTPVPTAMEAWEEVQKQIRRVGHSGKPQFENPLAAAMVDFMGWYYLCMSENGMADRAHFLKSYDQLAERENKQRVMLPQVRELALKLTAGKDDNATDVPQIS